MTRAEQHLSQRLNQLGKPVIRPVEFFREVVKMYENPLKLPLYLRNAQPGYDEYQRLQRRLRRVGSIGSDPDYGTSAIRVMSQPDLPADETVCLADRTCHVAYLSAMQRWGLTNRSPHALMLVRPSRHVASRLLNTYRIQELGPDLASAIPFKGISHPPTVRGRSVATYTRKAVGASLNARGLNIRVSTIGQTFLDMLYRPELCGGMQHVLDVWRDHAGTYLELIVDAIESSPSAIVKCRAGYILDECLGIRHAHLSRWTAYAQRGGSRKLDASKPYAPVFSETWMLSVNA